MIKGGETYMLSIKKKIAMSITTISLAAALVGGATFAWYTDTETNIGNTFSSGPSK